MADLITVREFARREGCDEKQVRRAIEKGLLHKDLSGLLDASQVDSGWRKTNRRGREVVEGRDADTSQNVRTSVRTARSSGVGGRAPPAPAPALPGADDGETVAEAAERIALAAAPYDRKEAERIKENYLALLKQLEYEKERRTLVELATAERVLFEEARASRDAWLNWPSRVGPMIAADLGLEADRVTEVLTEHVHKQIDQLGDPSADFAEPT